MALKSMDPVELRLAMGRSISILLFGIVPAALLLLVLTWSFRGSQFVSDFRGDLYNAGRAILSGRTPYEVGFLAHLARIAASGGHPTTTFAVPVYPAPGLVLATPLALVPFRAAGILFTVLSLAALLGGLRLLGVSDWRCYGAVLLSWPAIHSMRLGQVNGLLVLGLGLLWRGRDRTWAAGAATAAVVVAKLFLWPMGLFLLLTRRRRHAAAAVLLGAVSVLAGWAVIGFNGLGSYPAMVGHLSAIEGPAGISLVSLASSLGLGSGIGVAAAWLSCAGVLVLAALVLRGDGAEDRAFALCVVAGLLGSTLVWPHYFVLLYVAIALLSPRLGPLWLIPLVTWLAPVELTHGSAWRIAVYLVLELTVVAVLVARPLLAFLRQRARVTAASTP